MWLGNAGSFILLLVKIPRRADVLVEAGPFGWNGAGVGV